MPTSRQVAQLNAQIDHATALRDRLLRLRDMFATFAESDLLMFVPMGLAPLSAAATGWLLRATSLATVLAGAGVAALAVVAAGFSFTRIRRLAEA
jgi:hypothetical protein